MVEAMNRSAVKGDAEVVATGRSLLGGSMGHLIGIDTGGTFTDCVVMGEDGRLWTGKSSTTPAI